MDLIIKNGTIVTAETTFKGDIAVHDGKIKAISSELPFDYGKAQVVDAEGLLVLPGAIDGHTHLEMPFGGTISADNYEAGTRAAACGGTFTVTFGGAVGACALDGCAPPITFTLISNSRIACW